MSGEIHDWGTLPTGEIALLGPLPAFTDVSRRGFIRMSAGAGAGLMLGVGLSAGAGAQVGAPAPVVPSAYVQIKPDGQTILFAKNPDMGQGVKTAFALVLAEELDADWNAVSVVQSDVDAARYGSQMAGGSLSITLNWTTLRQAGAGARAMLVAAAAKQWGVPAAELTTSAGTVRHAASGRSASYGSLADAAAQLPTPDIATLPLKGRGQFTLLGKRYGQVDSRKIVTGQPLFGIDVEVPNMRVAVFQKSPAVFGKVKTANLAEIKALPGVTDAFIVEGTGKPAESLAGVAIIAKDTWSAISAKRKLNIEWDLAEASSDSWKAITAKASGLSANKVGELLVRANGDADAAMAGKKMVEAYYTYSFVAHAQLEPMNCTAWYKTGPQGDSIEFWAPTQTPTAGRTLISTVFKLPQDKITIHQQRIGGGFGRRLNNDYMIEAAFISRQAGGIPIKLMWTREDDFEHDFLRSGGFMKFRGALDAKGSVAGWMSHLIHFASQGSTAITAANWPVGEFPANHIANYHASQTKLPLKIPTGSWRAPGSNTSGWLVQSFMHEMSVAAGRNHAEFLDEVLAMTAPPAAGATLPAPSPLANFSRDRARGVVKAVVERSGYGKRKLPKGRGLGLAFHFSHQGHIAEVVELSVSKDKKVTVHKVWVVADVGPIVNLSGAEGQAQGSIIDAISTLGLEVTIENGQIEQKNFDQYPIGRIGITPEVDVQFIQSDNPPTGLGEPCLPPLAPAVCNAIFAATGHRIRSLPITREGYSI